MENIDRRNTAAVEQTVKEFTEKSFAQQVRIDGLVATVGGLLERVSALETSLNLLRVAITGRGPTR